MEVIERRLRVDRPSDPRYRPGRIAARIAAEALPAADARLRPRISSPLFGGLSFATTIIVGLALLAGLLFVVGTRPASSPDLLDRVLESGVLRVSVRPDHPQLRLPGGGVSGFDIDVANELARRLGVRAELEIVPVETMLVPAEVGRWDVAVPSAGEASVDTGRFTLSDPYYFWPRYLLVEETSGRATIEDVRGQPICAVTGDVGEAWLRGSGDAEPITSAVVTKPSDASCLEALAGLEVIATVTARFSPADLEVRPSLVAIGGPPAEPRPVVASRAAGPDRLVARINSILEEIRADGTLTRLSANRFGGHDLSSPPAN